MMICDDDDGGDDDDDDDNDDDHEEFLYTLKILHKSSSEPIALWSGLHSRFPHKSVYTMICI